MSKFSELEKDNFSRGLKQDDRNIVISHNGARRVVYKNHARRNRNKNGRRRDRGNKIRIFQDEDEDTDSIPRRSNERFRRLCRDLFWESIRKNYRQTLKRVRQTLNNNITWNHNRGNRRIERIGCIKYLSESPSHWYKIIIRFGGRYEKDYVLKLLSDFIKPLPLTPLGYTKINNKDVSFIIEGHTTAEELSKAGGRIVTNNGNKIFIKVKSYHPVVEINTKIIEIIQKVMPTRYNQYTKALDISEFHLEPNFLAENIFCPLNVENIMASVVDIINASIPDLAALDISKNNLYKINFMNIMVEKIPNLRSLHIGHNKLEDIRQLEALKGLNLEELVLNGNSLCDKFEKEYEYIREVRVRFPKVIKLDGVDLPPPFDVGDDECKVPPSHASFMCDLELGESMVRPFLEQYYRIYDSASREPLVQAYHDDAQFSLDCYLPLGTNKSKFSSYIQNARNLFKTTTSDKRMKHLKIGKNKIVEMLRSLPRTEHDPTSFIVDLVLFTATMIELNVCGLFKERYKDDTQVKYFNRLFIIAPHGNGYCIVNDLLTIMPATMDQIRKLTKVRGNPATAPEDLSAELDISVKRQMVVILSKNSGMNLLWSQKCLTDTNWNFTEALNAFFRLQIAGTIPAEAFEK